MYEEYFGLKEKPFDLVPSYRYLYLSEGHKEALALLTYGVLERRGFVLLTGDVGTGKTTVIQALLSNLGTDVEYVHVSNPLLRPREFLDFLASSTFKRRVRFKSKVDFLFEFESFLKDRLDRGTTYLVIVDEAQALPFELMEEIRLLSNIEYAGRKLVNIFLVGQPELNEKLRDPRCKPLQQRIASRYHLPPLDLKGTESYLETRLKVAGVEDARSIFPSKSIQAIHEASRGTPRIINILADNALLLGYSRGRKKISPDMIKECYAEMEQDLEPAGEKPETSGQAHPGESEARPRSLRRTLLLVLLLAVSIAAALMELRSRQFLSSFLPAAGEANHKVVDKIERTRHVIQPSREDPGEAPVEPEPSPAEANEPVEPGPEPSPPAAAPEKAPEEPGPEEVVVRQGDSLAKLAMDIYGRADEEILELLKESNPEIQDINSIRVGQRILFPPPGGNVKSVTGGYTVHVASYKPFKGAHDAFRRLIARGYETYIIPAANLGEGVIYRITIGNFPTRSRASEYAEGLLSGEEFEYAQVLHFEVK